MNIDEAIRGLESAPRDIRVECPPHGHFIVDMTLSVINNELSWHRHRSKKDLRRRASRGQPDFYGIATPSADRNTVLECVASHCGYAGRRNEMQLALELADAALRGHAVHRLTF